MGEKYRAFWIKKNKLSNANMVAFNNKPTSIGMSFECFKVIEHAAVEALEKENAELKAEAERLEIQLDFQVDERVKMAEENAELVSCLEYIAARKMESETTLADLPAIAFDCLASHKAKHGTLGSTERT